MQPENLLLDDDLNIKLCDFGWATSQINCMRSTFCGTYEYMAPEMVLENRYDYRIDIWALGVLLYELVHGKAPFQA
jgi:serine/threonine protein kinase